MGRYRSSQSHRKSFAFERYIDSIPARFEFQRLANPTPYSCFGRDLLRRFLNIDYPNHNRYHERDSWRTGLVGR